MFFLTYTVFKTFAALALTVASFGATVLPANAAPTTCAAREGRGDVTEFPCDVSKRVNANGHKVWDVAVPRPDGKFNRVSFVFWTTNNGTPSYAEVFTTSGREVATWFYTNNGAVGVTDEHNRHFYFN